MEAIREGVLRAYRWQYIVSGVRHPHFTRLLGGMTTRAQMQRLEAALADIADRVHAVDDLFVEADACSIWGGGVIGRVLRQR